AAAHSGTGSTKTKSRHIPPEYEEPACLDAAIKNDADFVLSYDSDSLSSGLREVFQLTRKAIDSCANHIAAKDFRTKFHWLEKLIQLEVDYSDMIDRMTWWKDSTQRHLRRLKQLNEKVAVVRLRQSE